MILDKFKQQLVVPSEMTKSENRWLYCRQYRESARYRIVCFPPAGGATSAFFPWSEELPIDFEVHAVQLPGRERRRNEKLETEIHKVIPPLATEIEALSEKPLIFFGHSLGGLLAFEVARELQRRCGIELAHLFVAARQAPQAVVIPLEKLPDDQFVRFIETTYGSLPAAIRADRDLLNFFLPIIRADMQLLSSYQFYQDRSLNCPISVYGGSDDATATQQQLLEWSQHTSEPFRVKMFNGGHFFPQSNRSEMLQALIAEIQSE